MTAPHSRTSNRWTSRPWTWTSAFRGRVTRPATAPRVGCRHDDERGSAAIEAAILVPAFMLFIGLLIFAGRTAVAHQGLEAVAADAARAASIARTPADAQAGAQQAVDYALANNDLHCVHTSVELDTSGLTVPVGTPGTVTATVTCTLGLGDLAVPGVPGTKTVTATMVSPVDAWRSRP